MFILPTFLSPIKILDHISHENRKYYLKIQALKTTPASGTGQLLCQCSVTIRQGLVRPAFSCSLEKGTKHIFIG